MKKSKIWIILAVLLVTPMVTASTIKGNIYDINLNPAENTILKITTTPEQTYVSRDGTYEFIIPKGKYIITAAYTENSKKYTLKKEIEIIEEGSYVLDLILFPENIPPDMPPEPQKTKTNYLLYTIIIILILTVIGYLIYRFKPKKQQKEEIETDELPNKVLKFIKEQDGRTTQKDIRKKFQSLSEAKISLVIAELEHKNKIKKIKKGRGNIIILDN